ncbi:MAG: amidohydrolase family protein [Acidimicrobiaceae bacterium]|nr:amidohydrolase family protein [Acidimicrobiaceae bacterium]
MRVLRNARLADGRHVDVRIDTAEGTIAGVAAAGSTEAGDEGEGDEGEVDDLGGWLLLPAMAEPHAHLDKALTADEVPNPTGDLMGAINAWFEAAEKGRLSHERTVERATQAFEMLLVHGVTAVRTHINVTADIGVSSVLAVQEAARSMEGLIDYQTVALTGWPMTGPDSAPSVRALEAAVEAGVDLVGGVPNLQDDPPACIADVLSLATSAGIDIDLHTDETLDPSVLTLRELARQVSDKGFDGTVAASHCVSLGMQPPDVQAAVAAEVAAAGISVITLPQTNLFLQGRDDPRATPRGLTAVQALLDAGAAVAAGADNVQDPFNLVGRSDPLETAALMVMAGHRLPADAYGMVSNTARQVMGLAPVNFEPGDPADLVAIDAPSLRGAVADAPMSRRVYRRGRLVASSDQQTRVLRHD